MVSFLHPAHAPHPRNCGCHPFFRSTQASGWATAWASSTTSISSSSCSTPSSVSQERGPARVPRTHICFSFVSSRFPFPLPVSAHCSRFHAASYMFMIGMSGTLWAYFSVSSLSIGSTCWLSTIRRNHHQKTQAGCLPVFGCSQASCDHRLVQRPGRPVVVCAKQSDAGFSAQSTSHGQDHPFGVISRLQPFGC